MERGQDRRRGLGLENFSLDVIREGDREKVLELQRKAGCDFPIPDPLTGFVVRDGEQLIGWAGWEKVAEVLGMVDVDLSAKEKVRIWASLHKPIESESPTWGSGAHAPDRTANRRLAHGRLAVS